MKKANKRKGARMKEIKPKYEIVIADLEATIRIMDAFIELVDDEKEIVSYMFKVVKEKAEELLLEIEKGTIKTVTKVIS